MTSISYLRCAVLTFIVLVSSLAAEAQQATQWADVLHSQSRMVRGITHADGTVEIGIHIKLDDGWKTYWRVPGDAGVPPEFDWTGSENVAGASVLWPAPIRFRDRYGESIGYEDEVVFPVVIRPRDWTKAAIVRLTLHYAVCKDICAPVRADLALELSTQSIVPRFAGLIARYRTRVPLPATEVEGLRVADVRVDAAGSEIHLVVDVESTDVSRPVDVFVEGAKRFYFATPRETPSPSLGRKSFRIRIDGAEDRAALPGTDLQFVLVQGDKRVAQSWKLQ